MKVKRKIPRDYWDVTDEEILRSWFHVPRFCYECGGQKEAIDAAREEMEQERIEIKENK